MNAAYVNPFLHSATLIFKQMLGQNLLRGKTSIKKSTTPGRDIAIIVGIVGSVTGQVIYSMNIETIYSIVRHLMPGIDANSLESEYRDVIGELANMITGNAINTFLEKNTDLDLTVPQVVDTRKQTLKYKEAVSLGLNLYSEFGMLEVNVQMDE